MATSNEIESKKFYSTFLRGSEEDYYIVCLPCYRDDTTVPASGYCIDCKEHLCPTCFKHHKRATPSRHHKLLDKDTMPTTQLLTDTSIDADITDNLTTPCSRHKNEMIKLYCYDHSLLLCCICIALEHKTCHVDYIPEISDQMIDSKSYKDIMERIDKLLMKCSTKLSEASRDTSSSNDSLENVLQEIETYRQRINKRMDELEKVVKDKYEDIKVRNNEKMGTIKMVCEDVMKMVNIAHDNMKRFNTSKQGNKLFIEVTQAQKQLQDYENSIRSISEERFDEYKFIPNQAINDVLKNEKMIGDIITKHETALDRSSELIYAATPDDITPILVNQIDVNTSVDENYCLITGLTMLPPDRLVLVDRNNISIKMVDVNSGFIISQLSLGTDDEDKPWDITSTTSTQVAVTVPQRQHIKLISVTDELSKQGKIQTDGDCYGICSHKNKLIVTYNSPMKLEILDMKGRVITQVTTDSTGKKIFKDPRYVQANGSSIYVSDFGHSEVIMLNWQGEITGRCEDFDIPTGLKLLGDGCLLVCDTELNKIYQLSGDCKTSRVIQQDVICPCAIYDIVDDEQHKLYISRNSRLHKYKNSIAVYSMKTRI